MTITAPRGKTISGFDAPVKNNIYPFIVGNIVELNSVAAQDVYGANHPSTTDQSKYCTFVCNGTDTVYTVPDAMNDLDQTVAASLDETNAMLVICMVNGEPLKRVGSDGTPSTGEFAATDVAEITFGDTHPVGTKIEVIALDASDVVHLTGGTTTAGRSYFIECPSFIVADGGVCNLLKANSV
jgi:hypothetical protein